MSAENEVEVRLIDVLETFARTPPSPGNAGVMDALSTSTGAKRLKILEAMWSAEDEGLL